MVKRLSRVRAAIGDVRRLREEIEKAERPDPRLERDLADAIAHLEAIKAKKEAKSKKKAVKGIRAELIEAEKEADQALKVETEAKRDTREAKKTADASRMSTWSFDRSISRFTRAGYVSYLENQKQKRTFHPADLTCYLKSLREKSASTWILEAAEARQEETHMALFNKECALYAAEKQLYEANARVLALQQHAPDSN